MVRRKTGPCPGLMNAEEFVEAHVNHNAIHLRVAPMIPNPAKTVILVNDKSLVATSHMYQNMQRAWESVRTIRQSRSAPTGSVMVWYNGLMRITRWVWEAAVNRLNSYCPLITNKQRCSARPGFLACHSVRISQSEHKGRHFGYTKPYSRSTRRMQAECDVWRLWPESFNPLASPLRGRRQNTCTVSCLIIQEPLTYYQFWCKQKG